MSNNITPNLWFNDNAKEAVDFYIEAFPESKMLSTSYYPNSAEEGLADFQLNRAGKHRRTYDQTRRLCPTDGNEKAGHR